MPHAVPFPVVMRFAHALAMIVFTRVFLARSTHYKAGLQCRLLRNVAAQFLAQFSRVVRVNLRVKTPA